MFKKLIVLDFDGIIFRDDLIIFFYIKKILEKVCMVGYEVMIVMGCLYWISGFYYYEFGLIMLIVNFNGVVYYYFRFIIFVEGYYYVIDL